MKSVGEPEPEGVATNATNIGIVEGHVNERGNEGGSGFGKEEHNVVQVKKLN